MPSDNPVAHVGREVEIEALGRTWKVGRWDRKVWIDFADWARTMLPDPIEAMTKHIDKLSLKDADTMRELMKRDYEEEDRCRKRFAEVAEKEGEAAAQKLPPPIRMAPQYVQLADVMAQRALDKASSYLSFNSPEMTSLLSSVPGETRIFWLLLKKHHPDVTEDDAFEIKMEIGQIKLADVMAAASGKAPTPKKSPDQAA